MTPPAAALWRPPGAMVGGTSYRQLRSLRSLASGYDYVALRADDAACGGYVAPYGRCRREGTVIRQLRPLRSLAGGYRYIALRADGRLTASINTPLRE